MSPAVELAIPAGRLSGAPGGGQTIGEGTGDRGRAVMAPVFKVPSQPQAALRRGAPPGRRRIGGERTAGGIPSRGARVVMTPVDEISSQPQVLRRGAAPGGGRTGGEWTSGGVASRGGMGVAPTVNVPSPAWRLRVDACGGRPGCGGRTGGGGGVGTHSGYRGGVSIGPERTGEAVSLRRHARRARRARRARLRELRRGSGCRIAPALDLVTEVRPAKRLPCLRWRDRLSELCCGLDPGGGGRP